MSPAPAAPSIPDDAVIARGRAALAAVDPAMARLEGRLAPFAWRTRPSGFGGLVRMIVGQQVSTLAADAVWNKLEARLGEVTPETLAALEDAEFRACGFSGQKTRYARALVEAHTGGALDLATLPALDDEAAMAALVSVKGVGRWTGEVYLMMAEGRLDVFPAGDIAVQEAMRWLDGGPARLTAQEAYARAEIWRPYRAVAAHMLWEWYVAVKAGREAHPLAQVSEANV